jgi:hypothetical protein
MPFVHIWSRWHVTQEGPQCTGSDDVFWQPSGQSCWFGGQVHAPFMQPWPDAQMVQFVPQCCGSLDTSKQPLSHAT